MTEIWEPVQGYEGYYEVSNLGNVRSLNYHKWGIVKNLTPVKDKDGYERVCLCKDNVQSTAMVHRLVAQAFMDNPHNYTQVNHRNEDKTDNQVDNLEWCDCVYNNNYGTRNERISKSTRNTRCKKVIQFDLQGNKIKEWVSLNEIGRCLPYDISHIGRVCQGKKLTAYGYKWQYVC